MPGTLAEDEGRLKNSDVTFEFAFSLASAGDSVPSTTCNTLSKLTEKIHQLEQ